MRTRTSSTRTDSRPGRRKRPAHAFKPFGTGDRACIGRQFALHEAVLALGLLLRRFDFEATRYELKVVERLTLMPKGFELTIHPRTPLARAHAEAADQAEPSEVCPASSIDHPGFQATSHGCPSGSAK